MAPVMKRLHRSGRRPGERGQALVEFVLLLPLALAFLFGIVTVASLARARYQVALVAHGVMREAAGGMTAADLNAAAQVYARAAGLSPRATLTVTVGAAAAGGAPAGTGGGLLARLGRVATPGTPVTVRALVPVSAPLFRLLPGGGWLVGGYLPVTCTSTCLIGTWKSPAAWIKDGLGVKTGGGAHG